MDSQTVADAIVDVAARLILPRFGQLRPDEVHAKKPGDLVTVADREAEAELTRFLRAADRGALVVGEEATFADPALLSGLSDAPRAWLVDPLDGTNNFARGNPDFGVLVAELRAGTTVRGWIWQPVAGRMFVAERGAGVQCDAAEMPRLGAAGGTVRARVPWGLRRRAVDGFDLQGSARCCATDYPALLEGAVDLLAFTHHWPWDHAAGVLMLTELGGFAALDSGEPWRAGDRGRLLLAAASETLWRQARAALMPS